MNTRFAISKVFALATILGLSCDAFLPRRSSSSVPVNLNRHGSDNANSDSFSTSIDFALDPTSPKAKEMMTNLGLSVAQHQQLAALAVLVVDWNSKVNLVSRRDCSKEIVFGRHIVPSLAPLGMPDPIIRDKAKVVDVGTGGGFPGLPLAIAYPDIDFLLVDSVGKKLTAVQDMADTLGLKNVRTHHGRAEVLDEQTFDVCVGRSVAAIPTYCFWIQNLLEKDGNLLYMIGGDIEEELLEQATFDCDIDELLECPGASDKRVLVFPHDNVRSIAAASGEKIRVPTSQKIGRRKQPRNRARGEWSKRDNAQPKQRGYENFKRFDSLDGGSS